MKEFRDKVAVVTGAASGIGRAIAERCAQEGMKVVLAGINEDTLAVAEQELKANGATVFSVRTDVAQRHDIEALAERTLSTFGAVHLLVNNAGVVAGSSVWESTWEDWEWVMGVNLWGVIYGVKVFTPIMLAQDTECSIVNNASVSGLIESHPSASYNLTKHAVVALSENLYLSLAQRDARVKVSVVCAGWVPTRILDSARNRPGAPKNGPPDIWNPASPTPKKSSRQFVDPGTSAEVVADYVFRGIREDQLYIITHPWFKPRIKERMENILNERNPSI